jgi:toxin ParE1/3/4
MHDIVIRRAALFDLDGIARYTTDRWGVEQAEKYLAAIRYDIESLASFPRRNPPQAGKHTNIRKMASCHHIVFYRVMDDKVEIARVLHERQDVPGDLDDQT